MYFNLLQKNLGSRRYNWNINFISMINNTFNGGLVYILKKMYFIFNIGKD